MTFLFINQKASLVSVRSFFMVVKSFDGRKFKIRSFADLLIAKDATSFKTVANSNYKMFSRSASYRNSRDILHDMIQHLDSKYDTMF